MPLLAVGASLGRLFGVALYEIMGLDPSIPSDDVGFAASDFAIISASAFTAAGNVHTHT